MKEYKIITLENCDTNNFNLIKKEVLSSCGFKDFDNILKTPLFIKVLRHVYDNFLKESYTESHCTYLNNDEKLEYEYTDYMGNKFNETINKPNHALAHIVRVACWIQLLYLQDKLYNNINEEFNQTFLMKTCIASLFMVSGRESEADLTSDIKRDCPDIKLEPLQPYERYLNQSAENFNNYVNLPEIKNLGIFTEEDIEDYQYCLQNYNTIREKKILRKKKKEKIATYFYIAYGNDLIRCRKDVTVGTMLNDIKHESYKNEQKLSAQLIYDIVKNTGDKIMSTHLYYDINSTKTLEPQNYDMKLFYLCSTNPEYCITSVLNTTDEYFNQLVYKLMKNENEQGTAKEGTAGKDSKDKIFKLNKLSSSSSVQLPILKGGVISENFDAFISDDNNIDIDSINVEINNSNLGSTFYMSSKSYREIIKENYKKDPSKDDFTNNGIYFQNICICFNKSEDIIYKQNIYKKIIDKEQVDEMEIRNYEKYVYPQYFIKTVKNKSTAQQIKNYLTVRADETVSQSIKKSTNQVDEDPDSVINFRSKYLKYKKKYIELKNKLNL